MYGSVFLPTKQCAQALHCICLTAPESNVRPSGVLRCQFLRQQLEECGGTQLPVYRSVFLPTKQCTLALSIHQLVTLPVTRERETQHCTLVAMLWALLLVPEAAAGAQSRQAACLQL